VNVFVLETLLLFQLTGLENFEHEMS